MLRLLTYYPSHCTGNKAMSTVKVEPLVLRLQLDEFYSEECISCWGIRVDIKTSLKKARSFTTTTATTDIGGGLCWFQQPWENAKHSSVWNNAQQRPRRNSSTRHPLYVSQTTARTPNRERNNPTIEDLSGIPRNESHIVSQSNVNGILPPMRSQSVVLSGGNITTKVFYTGTTKQVLQCRFTDNPSEV